jgi:hypothetical protein
MGLKQQYTHTQTSLRSNSNKKEWNKSCSKLV